jgi:uncharacterized protein YndB with AHSA1/START domain
MTKKLTIERTFQAPLADVWELWTTKDGIEAWWGPEGFTVQVHKLELKKGGEVHYSMVATGAEQIEFMKKAGMPLSIPQRITFTEVDPPRRLAWSSVADFIPGVAPYPVTNVVELHQDKGAVRMVLTLDAMHDQTWTERSVMGWESQLGKLVRMLENRAQSR